VGGRVDRTHLSTNKPSPHQSPQNPSSHSEHADSATLEFSHESRSPRGLTMSERHCPASLRVCSVYLLCISMALRCTLKASQSSCVG
jgi:hypothetical protein